MDLDDVIEDGADSMAAECEIGKRRAGRPPGTKSKRRRRSVNGFDRNVLTSSQRQIWDNEDGSNDGSF